MKITFNHPDTGRPAILTDDGSVMSDADGIKAIRKGAGMSTQAFADLVGVSKRTVEGWESGRMPSRLAFWAMAQLIERKEAE